MQHMCNSYCAKVSKAMPVIHCSPLLRQTSMLGLQRLHLCLHACRSAEKQFDLLEHEHFQAGTMFPHRQAQQAESSTQCGRHCSRLMQPHVHAWRCMQWSDWEPACAWQYLALLLLLVL